MEKWFNGKGNDNDVALFTKVRLARNLSDVPFKSKMSRDIKRNTVKKLYASVKNSDLAGDFSLVDLTNASQIKALSFAEKQYISPEFAAEQGSFLLSAKEDISVMLCEEDHIRITAFSAGLNTEQAYQKADRVDNVFLKNMKIAFDERLGFLTANPMNLGTGLKVSVGLHLPALKANNAIDGLISMVGKLGLSLRKLYGEKGAFYLLSNQISLGITEKSALENITAVANQIIKRERALRDVIKSSERWEDILYRSAGTLQMARKLEFGEFLELISNVRLGTVLGIFDMDMKNIGYLIHNSAEATVLSDYNSEEEPELAPKLRANSVREKLR